MQEETKEEYIARHRKENGINASDDLFEMPVKKVVSFKERLTGIFFMILFTLFLWVILMIFGMMKSN